jgi:hypothetical protein
MMKIIFIVECHHIIHASFPFHIPLASTTTTSASRNSGNNRSGIAGSSSRFSPIIFELFGVGLLIFVIVSNVSIVVIAVVDAARGGIFVFGAG